MVALDAIDATFGEPVLYAGGGLPEAAAIPVIWSDTSGQRFQGPGNTLREVSCEVRYELLLERPGKADRITRGDTVWKPINVTDRDDLARWDVVLERVGAAA